MANLTTKQLTVLVRKSYKIDIRHPLRRVSHNVPSFWHHFCSWLHLENNGELTSDLQGMAIYMDDIHVLAMLTGSVFFFGSINSLVCYIHVATT